MPTNFSLSEQQQAQYKAWNEVHLADQHHGKEPYLGAIGGRVTYAFTQTSIGCMVKVSCACGAEKDLSEYDNW